MAKEKTTVLRVRMTENKMNLMKYFVKQLNAQGHKTDISKLTRFIIDYFFMALLLEEIDLNQIKTKFIKEFEGGK